jgi:protease-4
LQDVLAQIEHVADSADHSGLVVFVDQPQLSLTQINAIREAIAKARAADKTVIAFAEAYTMTDYLLASACDLVTLQHKGEVMLEGIAIEEMYLAGLFEKIGVQADFLQIGQYKGADEQFTRKGPSKAWDENFQALLESIYVQITGSIAESRGWDPRKLEDLMARSMMMSDTDLLTAGVIDRLVDRDLLTVTEDEFGEDWEWDAEMGLDSAPMQIDNPFAIFSLLFKTGNTTTRRPTIAVVHAHGPIFSGESSIGDGQFSSNSIGSKTIVRALSEALDDDNVKAVVIRLDSPGGSALASEMIWQAVRDVRAEKPVLISIGGMAASGGYYIACNGSQVFVEPASIVGSIGVVSGKFTLKGLYDWAGISIHRRSLGPNADMFNSVDPFTKEQRELMRESMTMIYEQFRQRVQLGRGDRLADIDAVDEGMLFTGTQAVENGMADHVGGLEDAIAAAAKEVSLNDGEYDLLDLPPAISLQHYFSEMFGVSAPRSAQGLSALMKQPQASQTLATARAILGPAWPGVQRTLMGLSILQNERVVLIAPSSIVIR